MKTSTTKSDIDSRDAIKQLVNTFYDRVREDEVIGFIFNDIAKVDWAHHLPQMYDFWESILFRRGAYRGNPLVAHAALVQRTVMGREQFQRWLTIFCATVDDLFAGPHAAFLKSAAADMAAVIHRKINHLPDTPDMVRPMSISSHDRA